ncbi:MAG TPA: Mpo1-like protein [Gammaproteobacteria bacterium]|nr:Mpo1-like protein [Gammaproteobacteria bacterium]
MQGAHQLLEKYGHSHTHPVNKRLHWVCVPLIVLSLLGLLWSIHVPVVMQVVPLLNWATLFLLVTIAYYFLLSTRLALGMAIYSLLMVFILATLDRAGVMIWQWSCVVFVLAWIGQFIGHHIEGKRPSFFQDLQFLLIGPMWLLAAIYRRLGMDY